MAKEQKLAHGLQKINNQNLYGGGHQFEGVNKRNPFIVFVTVDKDYNMYIEVEGLIQRIAEIPEHYERRDLMSEMCEFMIDREEFKALGNKGISNKFTRVYDDSPEELDKSNVLKNTYTRFYAFNMMNNNFRNHETYKNNSIFVVGSSKLLTMIAPYVDKVFVTRVLDDIIPEDATVVDKFPVDVYKKLFKKKQVLQSEMSEALASTNNGNQPTDRQIEYISEYMRTTKKIQKTKVNKKGPYFKYQFEIFSK